MVTPSQVAALTALSATRGCGPRHHRSSLERREQAWRLRTARTPFIGNSRSADVEKLASRNNMQPMVSFALHCQQFTMFIAVLLEDGNLESTPEEFPVNVCEGRHEVTGQGQNSEIRQWHRLTFLQHQVGEMTQGLHGPGNYTRAETDQDFE